VLGATLGVPEATLGELEATPGELDTPPVLAPALASAWVAGAARHAGAASAMSMDVFLNAIRMIRTPTG
jgi:hypothetical protein